METFQPVIHQYTTPKYLTVNVFLVETANVEFYELQVIILMKQAAELRKTIKELSNLPELDSTLCLSILEKQRRYKEIMVLAHQHLVLAEIFSDDPNAI